MRKWWQRNVVICCGAICLLLVGHAAAQQASPSLSSATVPRLVRFSGGAKDAQERPLSGVVGITFALYKDQEGGAPLWMEVQTVQLDGNGRYTALLGASTAEGVPLELFSANEARWLGVQPENQAEQPRVLLVSVPYALKAAEAKSLGGKPASAYVLSPTAGSAAASPTKAASPAAACTSGSCAVSTSSPGGTAGFIPMFTDRFRIAGGTPGLKVSWQVTGVRQDAYARTNPLVVEVEKSERERGHYIHPQLFGQPPAQSIEWAQHPLQMKRAEQSQAAEKLR